MLVYFRANFWSILESVLGSVLGLEWAKMRQDDSNEDFKNLKVPKSIIFKKRCFAIWKTYFSRLGSFQEAPEELQDLKRKGSKNGTPKTVFEPIFGAGVDSEMNPQKTENLTKN